LTPFQVEIGERQIADLRERLARTRWPDAETVDDWSQGLPLAYARELCAYWEQDYEMERVARRLNAVPQFTTEIDGLAVHFIHLRSPEPAAVPLVLTHGWPGSVLEFLDLLGPLTDPVAHGGAAEDAFHVVVPSLPGYGFGGKPTEPGWGVERIADAWAELMRRLGYERYVAQGGDWGAPVSIALAGRDPEHLAGLSLNYPLPPRPGTPEPTAEERADLADLKRFRVEGMGYSTQQATRPQTVAYGLTDSPAAQCAWIVEKFCAWSDCDGHPENSFSRDELLDNVMVYWLNATAGSSARLYWESFGSAFATVEEIAAPTAYVAYPREIIRLSERLARTRFADLRYYNRVERGGHFAALEVPEIFLREVRAGVRALGVR
jgi:pimeloyl-ACP methyl ester carboxylesterase